MFIPSDEPNSGDIDIVEESPVDKVSPIAILEALRLLVSLNTDLTNWGDFVWPSLSGRMLPLLMLCPLGSSPRFIGSKDSGL